MKSLCFFNSCHAWGGGEKWHYLAACWCRDRGFDVLVVTNTDSELAQRLLAEGVTVRPVRVSNLSFLNPFKVWQVLKLLQEFQVETLVLNLPSDAKLAGIAARFAGIPQVLYRRGMALPVRNSWLNRLVFRRLLSGVIANSQEVRRTILQNNAELIDKEKIHIICNGLDIAAYDRQESQPIYARQDDEIILGNAGRFVEQKGQTYLIELARNLKERGLKFKLLLAGKGELEEELRQQVKEAGLENELLFVGFIEQIKDFLESIDLFVSTSLHEGSSNVILEVMAAGKAIVGFDVSSIPEMVLHNHNGLLVPLGAVDALTEAVVQLIGDTAQREDMGRKGRQRIEEDFSITTMFENLERMIEQGAL